MCNLDLHLDILNINTISNDPSMSLSLTLDRNDKIKHYIRKTKQTHKLNVLRF